LARSAAFSQLCLLELKMKFVARRDGRVAEGARLESVYTLTGIGGSNPSLSASPFFLPLKDQVKGLSIKCGALILVLPMRRGSLQGLDHVNYFIRSR
jgi:hypothetical protein